LLDVNDAFIDDQLGAIFFRRWPSKGVSRLNAAIENPNRSAVYFTDCDIFTLLTRGASDGIISKRAL
jgi:hypothetical protein